MSEAETATIQTEIPLGLLTEVQKLVDAGWFRSLDEVVLDALRRFVESRRTELMEEFIREDIEWGLAGGDQGSSGCHLGCWALDPPRRTRVPGPTD